MTHERNVLSNKNVLFALSSLFYIYAICFWIHILNFYLCYGFIPYGDSQPTSNIFGRDEYVIVLLTIVLWSVPISTAMVIYRVVINKVIERKIVIAFISGILLFAFTFISS